MTLKEKKDFLLQMSFLERSAWWWLFANYGE